MVRVTYRRRVRLGAGDQGWREREGWRGEERERRVEGGEGKERKGVDTVALGVVWALYQKICVSSR